jgi:4-amino-4-deoxy-L-arabinose transferase-like glycosyltransferase
MPAHRPTLVVLVAAIAALAIGISPTPLWDEDEARFAAIARTMVETGDWIVPTFNGTLAVDKPVLMHWCMAACMTVFGVNEFAARLPSVIATLLTALALLRAGRRWFDDTTGVVAALAYVGCILVSIEAHAATPDAILTALTAWATVLLAESLMPAGGSLGRVGPGRAVAVGLLLGLAVVCKGPVGFAGPLAVIGTWAWCVAVDRRLTTSASRSLGGLVRQTLPAVGDVLVSLRPLAITAAAVAAAAPWYLAVHLRTHGEWTAGFFFVHNVGRFLAPMEKHSGGVFFHPLGMLVGFFPWSCYLPLAVVIAAWRVWRRPVAGRSEDALLLLLVWLAVWVGAFSAAATKLPNYVLPAYPAAGFLVAAIGVDAARRAARGGWPHPRWLTTGLAALAFGGVATAATVLVATRYGVPGAEPAAIVGLVPVAAAIACGLVATRRPWAAVTTFTAAALVYAALAVGPAGWRLASANTLPGFVRDLHTRDAGLRLGTYLLASPNVVFYADERVAQIGSASIDNAAAFLASDPSAVLLVPAPYLEELAPHLPPGYGEVARTRPVFRRHDVVAIGLTRDTEARTAGIKEVPR